VTASGQDLKVCAYPDKSVVTGYPGGNPVITCLHRGSVPAEQAAASLTVWDSRQAPGGIGPARNEPR
jgi:hypothetical protein